MPMSKERQFIFENPPPALYMLDRVKTEVIMIAARFN